MEGTIIESGYFGNSSSNIVHIKNFVDPITISKTYDFCKQIKSFTKIDEDDTWNNRVLQGEDFLASNPKLYKRINFIYLNRLKRKIEDKFKFLINEPQASIAIWRPGDYQPPHADKEQPDGSPNPFPFYDLSSLIYINNDYEGGEIFFPQHDIELKPSPGDAVFFPGDRNYLHGVNKIESGMRFTIPVFWTAKEKL